MVSTKKSPETRLPEKQVSVSPLHRVPASPSREVTHLRDLSAQQWKSGIAAWLGWLFDGLDMHLYILVYAQFVAQLLAVGSTRDPSVGRYASIIQGGFLLGW